jgi:hypothetical protein
MADFLKTLPKNTGNNAVPGRKSFVYTNVKAQEGGEEGSAYHLNSEAIETFLGLSSTNNLISHAAGAANLGKLNVDFKIDSIDYLRQTHSSWFDRHVDSHANGSLVFAIIALPTMEGLFSASPPPPHPTDKTVTMEGIFLVFCASSVLESESAVGSHG